VNDKADERVQQFQADQTVAQVLQKVADEAAQDLQSKTDIAATRMGEAQQKQMQAEVLASQTSAQKEELVAKLATARGTTVALEQSRQDALAQERQDRADREFREQQEAAAR